MTDQGDSFGSQYMSAPDVPPPAAQDAPSDQGGGFGSALQGFGQSVGSGLSSMFGGPQYKPADPDASPLDASADLLQQRITRAKGQISNPIWQMLAPDHVKSEADFITKSTEQLQQIEQQRQHAADVKSTARNWGLTKPDQFGAQATDTTLANEALRQWKDEGNFNAYKALSGLSSEWKNRADLYMPDAMGKFGQHVEGVQRGMTALDAAVDTRSETAYKAAREKIIREGDLDGIGVKSGQIPETRDGWMKARGPLQAQYNQASRTVNAFKVRQDQQNQAVPVTDEKVASRLEQNYQFANGESVPGFKAVSLPGYGDVQGVMGPPGSKDTTQRGVTWSNASPEQIKSIGEDVKNAVPKEDLEKSRNFNRTYRLATTDAKGNPLPEGRINTNPNVQQGVAESLASMLRGGSGGANVGLLKIETSKRGFIQGLIDKIETERSATINELKGKDVEPYLSKLTQNQVRDVMDVLKQHTGQSIAERTSGIAERAGRYGIPLDKLGLDKDIVENPGFRAAYDSALKAGNREIDSYPMVTIGDRRVMLPTGSNVPGAKVMTLDHGSDDRTPVGAPGALPAPGGQGINPSLPPAGPLSPGPGANGVRSAAGPGGTPSSPAGIPQSFADQIKQSEGFDARAKWDYKQFTNGYGTRAAHSAETLDRGTAEQRFNTKISKAASFVDKVNPNLDPGTRAALASLTFNSGEKWAESGLGEKIKAGDIAGAKAAFLQYNKAGGETNQGLASRRIREARWFGQGADATESPPDNPPLTAAATDPRLAALRSGSRGRRDTPQDREEAQRMAADAAPAIGGTVGMMAGGAVGGPLGAFVGGGIGGGLGQSAKDAMQGNPQSAGRILKEGAISAALSAAPGGSAAARALGVGARTAGVGAIEAGATAAEGGDAGDMLAAGATGLKYALGGEALSRFAALGGSAAYKFLSRYTQPALQDLSASAGKLAEARAILETEQPKLPGDAGANPKYEAAKKQADEATAAIKDHGQNPDDMVHAYEQAKAGTSAGEATVLRKAASEANATSQGYNQLRQDVRDAGVGVPKANQPLPNGPSAQIRTAENPTGKVEAKFAPDAENAEMLMKAPAKDWGEKWGQLQDAGKELIKKRMNFLAAGDKVSAQAMDDIFQGVRNQQKAVAEYVFGKAGGEKAIARLESLDKNWAKIMTATAGMDYGKMRSIIQAGNTPEYRKLAQSFREFAGDDPAAMRAFNAMRAGAQGRVTEETKLLLPLLVGEGATAMSGLNPLPGVATAAVTGHRLYKIWREYANAKVLGRAVKFADFFAHEAQQARPMPLGNAIQRGAVQSQPLNGIAAE